MPNYMLWSHTFCVKRFRNGGLFQRTPAPNLVAKVQVGASPAWDGPWGAPWWPLPASRWPQQALLPFNTSAYWLAFKTQAVLKQGWPLKPECVKIEGNKTKREHNKEPHDMVTRCGLHSKADS